MPLVQHQATHLVQPFHVLLLGRQERILPEVGENLLHQIADVADLELERHVRAVRTDEPTPPYLLKFVKQSGSICVLADRETRSHFPAEAMSSTRLERHAEAAFAVYESRDVRGEVHRKDQGRRVMEPGGSIQGRSTPESLRGLEGSSLTLGITCGTPARCREGSTDLSRLREWDHSHSGQRKVLPDKELRSGLLLPVFDHQGAGHFCRPLHVAMQLGLYLHPPSGCLASSL